MATLTGQSIATSYEQLLHVDRDGGGDTTTHVSVKDGDNGTTFGFTIASDALMMTSTNRLEFGDDGTYIHQSANGVLDLVSDSEIEINATTIGMNGEAELSGDLTVEGTVNGTEINTTDTNNLGLGTGAVDSIISGDYNTGVGDGALTACNEGSNNTASGYQSLFSNTAGIRNTATGFESLYSNTTGNQNTASGYYSLRSNTTGNYNTANGYRSLYSNTTGNQNTASGYNSLNANTTGISNTASGYLSLYSNTTGNYNTASGRNSLYELTTGSNNAGLGRDAGRNNSPSGTITTGSNIICLGNDDIEALYCADDTIASSDGRDKTDVEDFTAGLDFITQMRPVTYRWDKRTDYLDDDNTDPLSITPDGTHKKPKQHIGFISQEVQALEQALGFATDKDNELICNTNEDGTAMGLKYGRLVPVLVNAIKELSAKVEALEIQLTGEGAQ